MASHVSSSTWRPGYYAVQVLGTNHFSRVLANYRRFPLGADVVQWKISSDVRNHFLYLRRGRMSNSQVYAAKPGFGAQRKKGSKKAERPQQMKEVKDPVLQAREILSKKQEGNDNANTEGEAAEAPSLVVAEESSKFYSRSDEADFERKLAEVKRLSEDKAKADEYAKKYAAIDYDAPLPASPNGLADNLFAKFGIGLAVIVFGLLFALGDNVPTFSPKAEQSLVEKMQLKPDEVTKLQAQAKDLEKALKKNPDDRLSLEGAGVIYAQLGDFDKAAEFLQKVVQKSPRDVEALRLLAEVQDGKGDYDASIIAYRAAIRASPKESMTLLQGLTDTLLAAKKPSEAVGELLAARARLKTNAQQQLLLPNTGNGPTSSGDGDVDADAQNYETFDPIQVELLLGKSYAAWGGHTGDSVSVYDGLIASYPDDFRGYLAKGILLKDQGKTADAERMFIQARFLAPPEAKAAVDKYSGRQAMSS